MTTPRDQLYLDLFTTALEGGIGYWSVCSAYHHSVPGETSRNDLISDYKGFYARIEELEDDGEWRIDRSVIDRGYALAAFQPKWQNLAWSTERPPRVIDEDTDWDFDAGDADVIVQLGLFGDVKYG